MTTTSKIVRTLAWLCPLVLALAAGASAARAQEKFPDHPINFIVPWGPSGGADLLARTAGEIMSQDLVSFPVHR